MATAKLTTALLLSILLTGCATTTPHQENAVMYPGDAVWLFPRDRQRTECAVGALSCSAGIGKFDPQLCACE